MERIDYARLVRKGARASNLAHGPEGGMSVRSPLPNSDTACLGAFVGYAVDLSHFGARARFSTCATQLSNRVLRANILAHDLQLDLYHAWDVSLATLEISVGSGLSLFDQHFETRGVAP